MLDDVASPGTIRNLAENPRVEINVVDPIVRKGFRFKGRASVHTAGETYERGVQVLEERAYAASPDRIRSMVVIEVSEASELISPAYAHGASEHEIAAMWLQRHSDRRR